MHLDPCLSFNLLYSRHLVPLSSLLVPLIQGPITSNSPCNDQVCFPLGHSTSLHLGMNHGEASSISNGVVQVPCKGDGDVDESIASDGAGYEAYAPQGSFAGSGMEPTWKTRARL